MSEKPSYYAILTANVRYDKNLTDSEKLLYAEITALAEKTGICWASNKYFAELYDVTVVTISRRINKLKELGHISVEMQYKRGTKAIEKRLIRIDNRYYHESKEGINTNVKTPINTNVKDNITSKSNTTSINEKNTKKELFNSFWQAYPKKVSKGRAETTFNKQVKNQETLDLILEDLERRKNFKQWQVENGQYIPHPSTYLNNKGWLDEYEVKTVVGYDYSQDQF